MTVEFTYHGKQYVMTVDGLKEGDSLREVFSAAMLEAPKLYRSKPLRPHREDRLVSVPLTGTVNEVMVQEGQRVRKGDVLFTVEAMKMINEICAPTDGVVERVFVEQGHVAAAGKTAVTFGEEE